jgi:uncharacterized protein (DUF697 family)
MTQPTGKTYLPTASLRIRETCNFVTAHAATIMAATALLSPTDYTAMAEAITAIQGACTLIEKVEKLYDPYHGDNVARPEP